MLYLDDIKVEFESQGFRGTHFGISPDKDKTVMFLGNRQITDRLENEPNSCENIQHDGCRQTSTTVYKKSDWRKLYE